jgi:hypothetical protein
MVIVNTTVAKMQIDAVSQYENLKSKLGRLPTGPETTPIMNDVCNKNIGQSYLSQEQVIRIVAHCLSKLPILEEWVHPDCQCGCHH